MSAPTAIVLAAPGTNRDRDVALALRLAGAEVRHLSLSAVLAQPAVLDAGQLLVLAGGFSYADALGAGRMWSLHLRHGLAEALRGFVAAGRPVLGICNGFQVLTGTGLLPGALAHNTSGTFRCEWVRLVAPADTRCAWTSGLDDLECPIAHGEGRYVHPDPTALAGAGQVALRYATGNPNGSVDDIAGVCDDTGLVLGLMPHPENHVVDRQHPRHRRGGATGLAVELFRRGIDRARQT